jgi:hypothetical protein
MRTISLRQIARKLYLLRRQGSIGGNSLLATPRHIEGVCFLAALAQLPGGLLENFSRFFHRASHQWFLSLPARPTHDSWNLPMRYHSFEEYLGDYCELEPSAEYDGDNTFDEFERLYPGFLTELSRYMDAYAVAELEKTQTRACAGKCSSSWNLPGRRPRLCRWFSYPTHGTARLQQSIATAEPGPAGRGW